MQIYEMKAIQDLKTEFGKDTEILTSRHLCTHIHMCVCVNKNTRRDYEFEYGAWEEVEGGIGLWK